MIAIFEFIDYRKYLEAYYNEQKQATSYFSYRYFSQKACIRSPSFLKHVIDGKRNLTRLVIEKFATTLKLNRKESLYFRNLVLFNQAKTAEEKQEHYAVLKTLTGSVVEAILNNEQHIYFEKWYNPIIRELLCLYNFHDNYKLLAHMLEPPISVPDAKKAVALLVRLNLVKQDPGGRYSQTSRAITVDERLSSIIVRSFARDMVQRAAKALDEFDKTQRHISGMTMSVSDATYSVVVEEINAFKDRIKTIVGRDGNGTRVCQMNVSFFPVSKDVGSIETKGSRS